MQKAKEWSLRCRHESMFWDNNAFVTLTYDDEHLPENGSLRFKDLQDFLKRLRKRCKGVQVADSQFHRPIRYFACGEYGDKTKRPHYHLLLFNIRLDDKKKIGTAANGDPKYTSQTLSDLWTLGNHEIGEVTPASASYVAGYAAKKVARRPTDEFYEGIDRSTGEVLWTREREGIRMSLKPGLGQYWYDRYKSQLKHGFIVIDGKKLRVPRFYADKYKSEFPDDAARLRRSRQDFFMSVPVEETWDNRLQVKETIARARKRFFGRSGEKL